MHDAVSILSCNIERSWLYTPWLLLCSIVTNFGVRMFLQPRLRGQSGSIGGHHAVAVGTRAGDYWWRLRCGWRLDAGAELHRPRNQRQEAPHRSLRQKVGRGTTLLPCHSCAVMLRIVEGHVLPFGLQFRGVMLVQRMHMGQLMILKLSPTENAQYLLLWVMLVSSQTLA